MKYSEIIPVILGIWWFYDIRANKPYFAVHFKNHVDCIAKTVPAVHPLVSLQMQMLY